MLSFIFFNFKLLFIKLNKFKFNVLNIKSVIKSSQINKILIQIWV